MRSGAYCLILLVLFASARCASAEDEEFDIEHVKTPLTLPELLPEGGVDAVDIDFWLLIKVTHDGKPSGDRFMRWSIKPIYGHLVFTFQNGTAGNAKYHRMSTTTYSKEGKLVGYARVVHEHGRKSAEVVGKVVEGKLEITTTSFDKAGKALKPTTETKSLEPLKSTVPSEWFSLVAAYHIRKGSLGYRFARTDLHFHFQHAETVIEDVGVEQVEHNGKKFPAHLLLGDRNFGKRKRDSAESKLQYLVLANGELMYMRNLYYGYEFLGRRATAEQIKSQFWLPGSAAAPAPEAAPDQEAVPQEPADD